MNINNNIEKILHNLHINCTETHKGYYAPCPVHGGDNPHGWFLYKNENNIRWLCFTNQCHIEHGGDIYGLIKGITGYIDKDKIQKFLNKAIKSNNALNIGRHTSIKKHKKKISQIVDANILDDIILPSEYFLSRGYNEKILIKYNVGTINRKGLLYNRAFVPFYNEEMQFIGFSVRAPYPKCNQCKLYHSPTLDCLDRVNKIGFPKWYHVGIESSSVLYNYWFSKNDIKAKESIILVEGPGDVWRLEEAGIHNSVAILGNSLKRNQKILIDSMGIRNIIVMTDNDKAGIQGAKAIYEQCKNKYRIFFPKIETKDVGDLKLDKITSDIKPFLDNLRSYDDNRVVG